MLEVKVILHDANGGERKEVATMYITKDGTASDGSGDAPFGNYNAIVSWTYKDGRSRSVETRVEGFERRKSAWALVQTVLEEIAMQRRR